MRGQLFSTDFLVSVLLITVTLGLFVHSTEFSLAAFPSEDPDAALFSSALLGQVRTLALDPARISQSGCNGQASGKAWCYPLLPTDGAVASRFYDSDADPGGSLSVVLEDGVPLGPAHAAAVDVQSTGSGLFSDRFDATSGVHYLLFSSSDGTSPASNGKSYSLAYVLVPPGNSRSGFCVHESVSGTPDRVVQDNCGTQSTCPAVSAVERRLSCGTARCVFSVRICSGVSG